MTNAELVQKGIIKQTAITSGQYLGDQAITGNGASQAATLPALTNCVWAFAEGGAVYVAVNGTASANSGFYIPDGQARFVGPYSNMTSLAVFATAPAKAHIIYEAQ
jgi:hypothetical protein